MAQPVASFSITPNFLVVKLTDSSTNNPTSWAWDFGDASIADTTQSPNHTYINPGEYVIQLQATNVDGTSSITRRIVVSNIPILPLSLRDYIKCKFPSGWIIDTECMEAYIAQWQIQLSNLVIPPVTGNNIFDETKYTPLANALIASLVVYSLMNDIANQVMLGAIGPGSNGPLKKITTGPSDAEWFDRLDYLKLFFDPKNGFLNGMKGDICNLAQYIGIWLSMCPILPKPIIQLQISNHGPRPKPKYIPSLFPPFYKLTI